MTADAPGARILVVEDEAHLAEGLQFNLEAEGYEVAVVANGREAADTLTAPSPGFNLVILDLMLPEMNGFEVVRRTRAAGNFVAILILTAKDEAQDIVRGLEEGADDYLTKPFRLDELLARVRGLLRRRRWDGVKGGEARPRSISFGDVCVHFDRFEITSPRGSVSLTTREMGLLHALIRRKGEAVTRGELLERKPPPARSVRTCVRPPASRRTRVPMGSPSKATQWRRSPRLRRIPAALR